MESNIFSTSSEGGGPASKKRKLTMNKSENQYEAEIVKLKQEIQECQQELGKQIVKFARLEKETSVNSSKLDDIDMEEITAKEEELQSKIALLEQQIEGERTKYETELAELSAKVTDLERQRNENNGKIKNMESLISSTQNMKPDPELADKIQLLEDKNNEWQLKFDDSDKKIKELEVELKSKVSTESSLRKTIEDTQKSIAKKEKLSQIEFDKLQSKCDDSDKKIKDLQTQLKSKTKDDQKNIVEMRKQYENQKKLLNSSVEERNKKNKDLETQLETNTNSVSLLRKNIGEIKQQSENEKKIDRSTILEKNKKIVDLEAARKDSINKNVHLKEIESLKEKHEKEVKEKLELAAEKAETEINGLKANTEDLTKKLSNEKQTLIRLQSEIKELNDKLTVAKGNEEKLNSKIVEVTKKELDARTKITEQDKKIQASNAPQFFSMNGIHDGSARDRLNAVVTVEKLSQKNGILSLYSAEASVKPFTWKLSNRKPWFKIHVNDEFEIGLSEDLPEALRFIHSAKLTNLDLHNHYIAFGDFKKLVSSYTIKTFIGGPVYRNNVDGKKVNLRLDEILKELPNIETCEIYQGDMSSNAVEYKKLTKLPRFMKLQKFTFRHLSPYFNVLNFTGFIKTNPNVSFVFKYNYVFYDGKNNIRTREAELRKSLPPNCNVVVEY